MPSPLQAQIGKGEGCDLVVSALRTFASDRDLNITAWYAAEILGSSMEKNSLLMTEAGLPGLVAEAFRAFEGDKDVSVARGLGALGES
jgi:hypothetical protein